MLKFFKQKNTNGLVLRNSNGFTRLVDFKDALKGRTKSASLKLTTGFTLVEVLVALFIFSISILAIMAVLSKGISDISVVKKKITAEYLAQEGIELMRNIRDSNIIEDPSGGWTSFMTGMANCQNANNTCYIDNSSLNNLDNSNIIQCGGSCLELYYDNGRYSSSGSTASGFTREVWVDIVGGVGSSNEIEIFSKVSWDTGSGTHSITFSENLFNWLP